MMVNNHKKEGDTQMDTLQQTADGRCSCGHPVYVLVRPDEQDSVVCLDCGNGTSKASFDNNAGGWSVGRIDDLTRLRLRKVAGLK